VGVIVGVSIGAFFGVALCLFGCCFCPCCYLGKRMRGRHAGVATSSTELAAPAVQGQRVAVATTIPAPMPTAVVAQQVTTQKMTVVVPDGLATGQAFTVGTPAGPMQVTVPAGCGPGSSLQLDVPQQAQATVVATPA
jgi:hypothetical protein